MTVCRIYALLVIRRKVGLTELSMNESLIDLRRLALVNLVDPDAQRGQRARRVLSLVASETPSRYRPIWTGRCAAALDSTCRQTIPRIAGSTATQPVGVASRPRTRRDDHRPDWRRRLLIGCRAKAVLAGPAVSNNVTGRLVVSRHRASSSSPP